MLNTSNDQRKLLPNFEHLFATTAQAPGGVARLRELILTLAVQGKLVPQDPSDEPASELLKKIRAEKDRLIAEGKIKKDKPLAAIVEEEKPFELPVGWEWVRCADYFIELCTGPFGSVIHQEDYVENGIPLINPSHMVNGWIVHDPQISLSHSDAERLSAYRLSAGDIVLARRGEVGRYAIVTDREDGWLCGTGSFFLRLISDCDRSYLALIFRDSRFRRHLQGESVGTTMTNLNQRILLEALIAIPPLAEQSRIVARVEELMRLCDALEEKGRLEHTQHQQLLQAMLDSLTQTTDAQELARHWQRLAQHFDLLIDRPEAMDALEQTILQLAVRGLLVPQDPNDEPASELLEKIKEEKIDSLSKKKLKKTDRLDIKEFTYDLPDKWIWTALQDVALFGPENGLSPKPSNIETKYKCLTLTATTAGIFKGDYYKYVEISDEEADANYLKNQDLLIQRGNSIDYVGIAAIYDGIDNEYIYPDLMMRLRLSSQVDLKYVHLALISKDGRSYFRSVATGTQGNMPKVNQTAVNCRVPDDYARS